MAPPHGGVNDASELGRAPDESDRRLNRLGMSGDTPAPPELWAVQASATRRLTDVGRAVVGLGLVPVRDGHDVHSVESAFVGAGSPAMRPGTP